MVDWLTSNVSASRPLDRPDPRMKATSDSVNFSGWFGHRFGSIARSSGQPRGDASFQGSRSNPNKCGPLADGMRFAVVIKGPWSVWRRGAVKSRCFANSLPSFVPSRQRRSPGRSPALFWGQFRVKRLPAFLAALSSHLAHNLRNRAGIKANIRFPRPLAHILSIPSGK